MRRYGLVDIPDQASDIDAVPITRTITIDGTTYDLSVNRTWTTAGGSNIYNSDGTLTGNRTLTQSTYSLTFAGTTSSRFHSNGNVTIGTTTDIGAKLNVLGQAVFGDFVTQLKGVIAYSAASSTRLSVYDGRVLFTNAGDVSLWFDAGGSSAGGQPVKIYSEPYAGVPTQYPLCIQGNGLETIFGQDTITTNPSSLVTMVSTTKGFLPPRMTSAQRTAIGSPATGLIVYQTDGSAGLYVRNAGAWQLLGSGGGGGGTGTVTSVSVVSANGFAGTVANATTTPAITLSTTVTGLLKGNGTAISAATAGTDFQAPITLTTTGTTGAATFTSNTLNIPNYSSTVSSSGTFTPNVTNNTNCTIGTIYKAQYLKIGDVVTVSGCLYVTGTSSTNTYSFEIDIPVNNSGISNNTWASGVCITQTGGTTSNTNNTAGDISGVSSANRILISMAKTNNLSTSLVHWYHYTYRLIA